jgi:glycosyltransferase involved in cell wall biosynthesis
MKYCLVVPHYNHYLAFAGFLPELIATGLPCIVVDDGSSAASANSVEKILADYKQTWFLKHGINRGKGAAIFTGAYYARVLGFTHIVQIDADGQHNVDDVAKLIDYSESHPDTIVSGKPWFDEKAPKIRVYGRRITDFWVALESFSLQIKDGLCGFRVYPLSQLEKILDNYYLGVRMEIETEILVKAVWSNIPLHFIPTKVSYPENSVSHFHYWRDNLRLIKLHIRLLAGMIIRSPLLLRNRIRSILYTR